LTALGIKYWASEANFVLAHFGAARQALVAAMRQRGILVRDRNSDPGCAGCIRITVGAEAHTAVLLAALRECVAESRRAAEVSA
jgi:histidinol-phosphate aminotransferase